MHTKHFRNISEQNAYAQVYIFDLPKHFDHAMTKLQYSHTRLELDVSSEI